MLAPCPPAPLRARLAQRLLALPLVTCSLALPLAGCARLPALAIGARLRVVTEERAAAQSAALIVGCGWKLERDAVTRARAGEPPPESPPGATPDGELRDTRCADPSLCAWQRAAELGAAQALLPLAEEVAW
jgi:hypothetical protein